LGIEKKFYDTYLTDSALTAPTDFSGGEHDPSATSMISTPPQGDNQSERLGKRISIHSVQIKGNLKVNGEADQAGADNPQRCFVALVLDTQSNGAQLNSEEVFTQAGAAATTHNDTPLRNLLWGSRFRILKSMTHVFTLDGMAYSGTVNQIEQAGAATNFEWYIPFKDGLTVNFNAGTTPSIANVIDNSLHIIAFTTDASNAAQLSYLARIRYTG
jgi:hypothetical protein